MQRILAAAIGTALALCPLFSLADDAGNANTLRLYNWSDYIGEHTIADFE
jgi:putrescine transport system substrate-binding protein